MPSASPPDGPSPDGEVVEVFTGDSLEEAMAAAVAALGPDLTVRRARKVRAGVRGLLGRDRYEVLAVPPAGPARLTRVPDDDEDAVGSALEALLDAADAREAGGPQARPVGRPVASRPLAARPAADDLPAPLRDDRPAGAPLPPAPRSSGGPLRRGGRPRSAPDDDAPDVRDLRGEAPRARGRLLGGGPLAGSSPHPDPGVADHPDPADRGGRPGGRTASDRGRAAGEGAPGSARRPVPQAGSRSDGRGSDQDDDAPVQDLTPRAFRPPAPEETSGARSSRRRATDRPVEGTSDRLSAPSVSEPPVSAPPVSGPPVAEPPVSAPSVPEPSASAPPRRARTDPDDVEEDRSEPDVEPAAAPARAVRRPTSRKPRAGGWSIGALSTLGVPDQVLDALPGPVPRDDLAWVVALTAAIERCVPPPAEPDESTPVVVSGHGLAGAVAVLDAGCRGMAPGTITHAGRTAPATATELALVLRHHVTSGA